MCFSSKRGILVSRDVCFLSTLAVETGMILGEVLVPASLWISFPYAGREGKARITLMRDG